MRVEAITTNCLSTAEVDAMVRNAAVPSLSYSLARSRARTCHAQWGVGAIRTVSPGKGLCHDHRTVLRLVAWPLVCTSEPLNNRR